MRLGPNLPASLRDFLVVLAGSASVLGIVYLGMSLTLGTSWTEANAITIFTHGVYWLLLPPAVWAVRRHPAKAGFQSPRIKVIMDDGLVITEPCDWMGHGIIVAVFKVQDDVELFEFSAYVVNIQSNMLVQIRPDQREEQGFDIATLKREKEKLIFKPGQYR